MIISKVLKSFLVQALQKKTKFVWEKNKYMT